jgi:Fic family protein
MSCDSIHPFSDGNGRLSQLWRSLILSKWKPLWAYLPVETIISEQQGEYYDLLGKSAMAGDATLFVEFMVRILKCFRLASDKLGKGNKG